MFGAASLIPIRDDNPTRAFSYVTVALIALNIFAFFLQPGLGMGDSCRLNIFFYKWGVVPTEITHGEQLAGSLRSCPGIPLEEKSVLGSLFTSMFLHGGPLHLGGNMLFLWVFGNNIEDTLGKIRYLVFYLLTGLAAGLAHVFANPDSIVPTVGASGAVSGLLGAYLILFPRARVTTLVPVFFLMFMELPAIVVLGMWFVSQFFIGAGQQAGQAGVAWVAHVGGFIAGMILIFVFGGWAKRHRATHTPGW